MWAAKLCSASIADLVDEAWWAEGSGVPVGWKEGAVGFKGVIVVLLRGGVPLASPLGALIAEGAMVDKVGQESDIQHSRKLKKIKVRRTNETKEIVITHFV